MASEWYYAVKNFNGTSEEQLSVLAGEPLHLLDDSDNEWWYAISPRTQLAGYIPALFIEVLLPKSNPTAPPLPLLMASLLLPCLSVSLLLLLLLLLLLFSLL